MTDPPLLSPGQIIGQHRVERLLGRGGIAEVYLVTELAFEVRQALKVMVDDDADWARRLIREGRAQYLVQHPNLVRVLGSLTVVGRPALIMEYVEGSDLRRWLAELRRQRRWPSLNQSLEIFRGVLAGVGAVHQRGLVHRDLKPANILVERVPGGIVPKVTDFGLVKDLLTDSGAGEVTVAGTIMGTQGYIAPEQIWALPEIDARADVFALGCMLYLLACRRAAFGDADVSVTFSKVLNEEYTDPREHVPDLPEGVLMAIRYALVADRRGRIPSCEALWDVIERGLPALMELELIQPGQDPLPHGWQRPSPSIAAESFAAPEVTTTGRPLGEVQTVAMPMEMLDRFMDPDAGSEDRAKESTEPLPDPDSESEGGPELEAEPTWELPKQVDPAPVATPPMPSALTPSPAARRPRAARGSWLPTGMRALIVAAFTLAAASMVLVGVGAMMWLGVVGLPGDTPSAQDAPSDLAFAPSVAAVEPAEPSPVPASEPVVEQIPVQSGPVVVAPSASSTSPSTGGSSASAPARTPSASPPTPAATPAPSPRVTASPPQEPAPAPQQPAAPMGRVVIEGTAQRVCLLSHADGQEYCAAQVPTGGYDVLLYVNDAAVTAGVVDIEADSVTNLRCDSSFLTCY